MKLTVKYFASIREALGCASEVLDASEGTLLDLRNSLIARGGAHASALAHGKAVRMAVNQSLSPDATQLKDGDEVAFFPPVTGG
ncbi:MAG: molybdopterin converting factor subunit 1 [Rhodoferax sp.]|nr:molybdopterin converting factor subunit 1 [Rhodoferax sp.]